MSAFSDKCKKMIKENGTTVYRLSIETGLERTALQRMVNGQRIPNVDFVNQFISALRIPRKDKSELLELYQCESTGETTYYNRRYIRRIINNMIIEAYNNDIPDSNRLSDNADQLLSSKLEVVLNDVLEEGIKNNNDDSIKTNYPITNASFIRSVLRLSKKYTNTVKIQHMFSMKIKPEEVMHNLKTLNYMLPLVNSQYLEYEGYFQYSRMEDNGYSLMLYPFYIMTNNCVLLFNNTLSEYILVKVPELVSHYHTEFEKILSNSIPLIEIAESNSDALIKYGLFEYKKQTTKVIIESQPCFSDMMSEESFLSILKERASLLYDLGKNIVNSGVFKYSEGVCLFSKEGIIRFCETGKFEGQIGAFLPPLEISERKQALQYLLNEYSTKKKKLLLMEDEWLSPREVYFEVTGNSRVDIVNMTDLQNIKFFKVVDSNIGTAFTDFASALAESEYVCTEEETEAFLNSILMKLP
ncbi:hypothetical protein [Hespellia stercorisuis]|uniref:Uncharacterized protein n=1 Tax=Hespellia stercorisuis DSM 15480 TaxID=1121950 RepID=A0A1M6WIK0_9FIRM|nr:hypothetical protein [Hespellia stercorisuis]SHK93528.1 hypothetical protein SAMN02745243_04025 [Hespellia stercorisuis DSM 15480]